MKKYYVLAMFFLCEFAYGGASTDFNAFLQSNRDQLFGNQQPQAGQGNQSVTGVQSMQQGAPAGSNTQVSFGNILNNLRSTANGQNSPAGSNAVPMDNANISNNNNAQSGGGNQSIPGALSINDVFASSQNNNLDLSPSDFMPAEHEKVVAYVDLDLAQRVLDNASAFVLTDGQRVGCFGMVNGVPRTGVVKPATVRDAAVCMVFDPRTQTYQEVADFKIPVATAPFKWRKSSQTNPDEWLTGGAGLNATVDINGVTGVCAVKNSQTNQPEILGMAIRRKGLPAMCVINNSVFPLVHDTIIVAAR